MDDLCHLLRHLPEFLYLQQLYFIVVYRNQPFTLEVRESADGGLLGGSSQAGDIVPKDGHCRGIF